MYNTLAIYENIIIIIFLSATVIIKGLSNCLCTTKLNAENILIAVNINFIENRNSHAKRHIKKLLLRFILFQISQIVGQVTTSPNSYLFVIFDM